MVNETVWDQRECVRCFLNSVTVLVLATRIRRDSRVCRIWFQPSYTYASYSANQGRSRWKTSAAYRYPGPVLRNTASCTRSDSGCLNRWKQFAIYCRKAHLAYQRARKRFYNTFYSVSVSDWILPSSVTLQDSTGMKLWKKRWFVLSDMCLYYYRGESTMKNTYIFSKQ